MGLEASHELMDRIYNEGELFDKFIDVLRGSCQVGAARSLRSSNSCTISPAPAERSRRGYYFEKPMLGHKILHVTFSGNRLTLGALDESFREGCKNSSKLKGPWHLLGALEARG